MTATLRRNSIRGHGLVLATVLAMVAVGCGSTDDDAAEPATTAPAPSSTESTSTTITAARPSVGCEATRNTTTTTTTTNTEAVSTIEKTVTVDGVERTYLLAIPGDLSGGPAPVIVLLHGMGSTAADINRVSDLPTRAADVGMIVVTPQAVGTPTIWQPGDQGPDAAFLDQILDALDRTHCIDTARVHMAGFSAGAALAASYACARQDRIASIVTVTVESPAGCAEPMPILSFHGTADPVIAYGNYDPAAGPVTGTEANMAIWANTAGCQPIATTTEVGTEVSRLEWPGCADGAEVVLFRVLGGGHDWPGKDPATAIVPSTQQVSATNEALEFVSHHHA